MDKRDFRSSIEQTNGSRKGAEKTNEMSSRDEIIAFLLESGLGFEGYEHVESMDQLQRALEKELFSPSAGALADQISRRTKPAGGSSSSEDFQRVIQVQADVHHLPRELRSPEQSIEPNIVIREQTPLRVDSQLMVQAEVHVPSRDTEIGIAETIAQSEQMDTHQRQVQIPLLDRGLDTGGEEGVRRIDAQGIQITDQELWDQLNAITTLEEVRPLQQGENADKHGREVLDQRFWDQFNLITTEEENVTEKSKDTSISGIRVRPIHELFDAIDRIEQEAALEQPNAGTPVQYTETGTTEIGTGHWEAPPPNQDRVTVAPAIQSVADLLIHGVETRSPTHPAVIEIRSPPQGIIRAHDMDLLLPLEQRSPSLRLTQPIQQSTPRVSRQPEIASEQAETRSSPQTRPFPRIRELLEQNASLVRAPTPRVRKKKICYSEAVLTKKNKKTIKPQNLISYARRIDLWQESNCCPCLELFSLNYDQSYDAGARNLDYFREPFEELPPDYNFIGNLICHLFEQDEQDIDGEDTEAIRISDLRASIAAPERLRSIMKTSIRHSLHVDDRTKKSLLPVDQGRPSLPEIQPPPDLPEIRDVSRNIPNISNVLMEKSLEEPQIVPQQPILGHTPALEEPIVGPKTRSRSLAQSGSLAVSEIRENTLLTTSRREAISTVPELTTEVEQQRAMMPENDGPLLTNIQPQNVVQMEKEEEEPEVTPRRKRISVPEVAGNLASLWLNNVEKVNFTDLCPIGATNRFTAACTFSALLTLHRMKLITLEQEQGNIAPKFLTIERS